MIEDRPPTVELTKPRSVPQVLASAAMLLRRFPLLFLALATAVVGPYELIVLAVTGAAPFGQQRTRPSTAFTLYLIDFALVGPLVAALFVQAVLRIADGVRPRLAAIARDGVQVLPVVAAAQIVAGLCIALGLLAFILPGVLLALMWGVVAQAAAAERTDWIGALRRSRQLTARHYLHVFAVLAVAGLANFGLASAGEAVTGTSTQGGAVALGIVITTLTRAFTALTGTILYFDLLARERVKPTGV